MSGSPRRILVVGPAWVGDMVMMQPLIALLRERYPEAAIDVVAEPAALPVLDFVPGVRRAIPMPFRHRELALRGRWRLARALAPEKYDLALVTPRALKKAAVAWWAGIPRRIGLGRSRAFGILTEVRARGHGAPRHQVVRFLSLGLAAGEPLPDVVPAPRLAVAPEQIEAALAASGLARPARPLLVLAPGSGGLLTKRWPAAHFAAVARDRLAAGWAVWIFGSPIERALADSVAAEAPGARNLAGLDLRPAIALLALADGVVANDSGFMHAGAALGCRTVGLFGPTSPVQVVPRSPEMRALSLGLSCSPCGQSPCPLGHFRCMRDLAPGSVLAALGVSQKNGAA